MIEAVYSPTMRILEKSMSLRMARHGLLAANIANAETPNYRAVDLDFQETMARLIEKTRRSENPQLELQKTDPRHVALAELRDFSSKEGIVFAAGDDVSVMNDNNSVNLEEQMARMQANTLLYTAMSQILQRNLSGIKGILESSSRI